MRFRRINRRSFLKLAFLTPAALFLRQAFTLLNRNKFGELFAEETNNLLNRQIKSRRLGKTNLMVSEIGIGGHEYTSKGRWKRIAELELGGQERLEIISKALDMGVNYFDATYREEYISLGRILKKLKARNRCIIACGEKMDEELKITNGDEKIIRRSVENQLKLLQVETIDILRVIGDFPWFAQDNFNDTKPKEIIRIARVIEKLKKEGKVRFSCYTTHHLKMPKMFEKVKIGELFDMFQIFYNFVQRETEKEIIPYAKTHDMGIINMKVFNSGRLLNKHPGWGFSIEEYSKLFEPTDPYFVNLEDHKRGLAQALLNFVLSNDNISVALLGVASVDQLMQNIETSFDRY